MLPAAFDSASMPWPYAKKRHIAPRQALPQTSLFKNFGAISENYIANSDESSYSARFQEIRVSLDRCDSDSVVREA